MNEIMERKRERIFYLDFIKAAAIMIIFIDHYEYPIAAAGRTDLCLIPLYIAGVYIGDIGSSVFLMISGAALMYVYENKLDLKIFYRKRFLSIFPMFWFAWIFFYLIQCVMDGGFEKLAPFRYFIFTIFGFDMYVQSFFKGAVPAWPVIGEWFLGLIIVFYILFPFLRVALLKHPIVTGAVAVFLFALTIYINPPVILNLLPTVCLPEFMFGMYMMKYFKKMPLTVPLIALAFLVLSSFVTMPFTHVLQVLLVGISFFVLLAWIGSLIRNKVVMRFFTWMAGLSYAVFLTHHFIINKVMAHTDLAALTAARNAGIMAACILITTRINPH